MSGRNHRNRQEAQNERRSAVMLKKFVFTMLFIIGTVISVNAAQEQPTDNQTKILAEKQEEAKKLAEKQAKTQAKIQEGVNLAIALRDKAISDSDIIEILTQDPEYRFGWAKLTQKQIEDLKAKFTTDFIKNYTGVPQYVTVGASAVYLFNSNTVVGGAILRIQITPRSFYAPTCGWPWSKIPDDVEDKIFSWKRIGYNLTPGNPNAWINRFDLNFGLTTAASTDNTNTESSPFILAGISYELHKAALLNFGYGFSTGGSNTKTGQLYFGITVDSNLLKTVGFIK
jgi:hypothetical protein